MEEEREPIILYCIWCKVQMEEQYYTDDGTLAELLCPKCFANTNID
jgi:hypothetical protein